MKVFCVFALLGASAAAFSQPSPRISGLLDRLRAYATDYREHLPSFSCDESATSRRVHDGQIKEEVRIEAVLRELRDPSDPDDFNDQYEFKLVNGRPPKSRFKIPYFPTRAFSNGIGFWGSGELDSCYDFRLEEEDNGSTLRLEIAAKPNLPQALCDGVYAGYRKTAVVDAASGVIRHISRSMSAEAARKHKEVFSAEIDFGPVALGERTFWLPVRAEMHHWDGQRQITTTYSNCHRFSGELKIVPGEPQPVPSGGQ